MLEEGNRSQLERIVVNPGANLSLQMHEHRSEHWIVVQEDERWEIIDGEAFDMTPAGKEVPGRPVFLSPPLSLADRAGFRRHEPEIGKIWSCVPGIPVHARLDGTVPGVLC